MKIAVISYHTCPLSDEKDSEIGGINTYILELSKALAEKGYSIDIFTRAVDKQSPEIVEVKPGLRVIHLTAGAKTEIPKKELIPFIPEFTENLIEFIQKNKLNYNLISSHYYLSGLIGLELKKKFKIPLFITFHTLALMKNLVARSEGEREDLQRIESEILLTKKADKIIATSESDLEYIHTLYDCPLAKIAILTPGVDLNLFHPMDKIKSKKIIGADPNHKLILLVGRIEPLKGIDVLLYALKILIQRNPKLMVCLWVVGGNLNEKELPGELNRLEKIRKLLKLKSSVKFVGKKERTKLPYYYNSAEIVLMPSQYESFGITALEAMACSVPVIITDVAGVSGLLDKEHSSLLTSAGNPIGLAKKINNLLNNNSEHKKMSGEVFKKVQDLNWEQIADKFTQILRK